MCTVTFVARKIGYCLGMNRDEKMTRPAGLPPEKRTVDGRVVLCPYEPGGGTWIAVNDHAVTFVIVNWYAITQHAGRNAISRGEVVNSVSAAGSPESAAAGLSALPLNRINPFRLIGIFPGTRETVEWRWDVKKLARKSHPWKTQQWISSGYDEPVAQRVRGRTFRSAQNQKSAGTLAWLRRLHRSHAPETGPFSTCMHRADAATVSYTEICVASREAMIRHHPGPPCEKNGVCRLGLKLLR
jgi:hypothetical protein